MSLGTWLLGGPGGLGPEALCIIFSERTANNRLQGLGHTLGVSPTASEALQSHPIHKRHHRGGVTAGSADAEAFQSGGGKALISAKAPLRGLLQVRIASRLQVQLKLGDLLGSIAAFDHQPLHFGRQLTRTWGRTTGTKGGGDLFEARDLIANVEQKALAEQGSLARKMIGQRTQRNAGLLRDASVGERCDAIATDQLQRRAQDPQTGAGNHRAMVNGFCGRGRQSRNLVRSNELER